MSQKHYLNNTPLFVQLPLTGYTLMQIANHLHNPPPAERKTPEQIIAPDITKLKQAHMKLREMADILGIEIQALEI
jgi:hypothetical protein